MATSISRSSISPSPQYIRSRSSPSYPRTYLILHSHSCWKRLCRSSRCFSVLHGGSGKNFRFVDTQSSMEDSHFEVVIKDPNTLPSTFLWLLALVFLISDVTVARSLIDLANRFLICSYYRASIID